MDSVIMKEQVSNILKNLTKGDDKIYSSQFVNTSQEEEIKLRDLVSSVVYDDYLKEIAKHHSIPVMSKEVKLFLDLIPEDGIIVDVGGCWGWHWRHLSQQRPDITVFIVDFIRSSLICAINVLGDMVNENIILVHGDANDLPFPDNSFNGLWTVQTFQHIPNFTRAVQEAYRVLQKEGVFINYSLNNNRLVSLIFLLLGKKYHLKGRVPGSFYLARASENQKKIISQIFHNDVKCRYTEILFTPDLRLMFGKEKSLIGGIDSILSMNFPLFSMIARQQAHFTKKIEMKD